jgi:hypothetical protein
MMLAYSIIDLLSILPYYITLAIHTSSGPWAALRVIRLIRLVRIFKLGSQSQTITAFTTSLRMGLPAMGMLAMYLCTYLFLFGSVIFECEKNQDDTLFTSIPATFWWGMATITTGLVQKKKKLDDCD